MNIFFVLNFKVLDFKLFSNCVKSAGFQFRQNEFASGDHHVHSRLLGFKQSFEMQITVKVFQDVDQQNADFTAGNLSGAELQ